MKFKIKQPPKVGEQKQKVKLAWWPIKIEDTWVWFEFYLATYKYVQLRCPMDLDKNLIFEEWQIINRQLIYDNDEPRSV